MWCNNAHIALTWRRFYLNCVKRIARGWGVLGCNPLTSVHIFFTATLQQGLPVPSLTPAQEANILAGETLPRETRAPETFAGETEIAIEVSTIPETAIAEDTETAVDEERRSQKRSEYSPAPSTSDEDETVDATPPRRKRYKSLYVVTALIMAITYCCCFVLGAH